MEQSHQRPTEPGQFELGCDDSIVYAPPFAASRVE